MSCCGSCKKGRKCEGKKRGRKRKNPNFLYMTNRRRRKNPASTNFIYEANGKRRRKNPYVVTVKGPRGSKRFIEKTPKAARAVARALMEASPHGHWPGFWPYVKAVGGGGSGMGISVTERKFRRKKRRS